jgi:rhamnosyltransferase
VAELLVTVVIPTYNGETYLDELLRMVALQQVDGPVEILVVDSGSTDDTLEIVRRHPAVRLMEIPNSEFGHGRTRGLAAQLAAGTFVVYLTQDAVPASPEWLAELLAPFALSERIALVTGRQAPRSRAFPLQRYEIIGVFDGLGPRNGITVYGAGATPLTESELAAAAFNSDVNAAVRRELVLGSLPFRDVPYAEDQMMGRDVLESGWLKAYAGRACVEHSNDLDRSEYGSRIFDETVGLRRLGAAIPPMGRMASIKHAIRGSLGDSLRIVRDPDYTAGRKLSWLFANPAYHVVKWRHYRLASRVDLADDVAVSAGSLEHRRKTTKEASRG